HTVPASAFVSRNFCYRLFLPLFRYKRRSLFFEKSLIRDGRKRLLFQKVQRRRARENQKRNCVRGDRRRLFSEKGQRRCVRKSLKWGNSRRDRERYVRGRSELLLCRSFSDFFFSDNPDGSLQRDKIFEQP